MAFGKEDQQVAVTPWFQGTEHPVREGVYQRAYNQDFNDLRYCFWDGELWRVGYKTIEDSAEYIRGFAHSQNLPWRGVTQ